MKILQINTNDIRGGAAKIAYSLHRHWQDLGHVSSMFVDQKNGQDPAVRTFKKQFAFGEMSRLSKSITGKDLPSFAYFKGREIICQLKASDIKGFAMDDFWQSPEYASADIIHCHNLHGNYFNLDALERIAREKKVVWTLHDMWPLTGHCAHAYDCERWETGCGKCPYLKTYPAILWDNTSAIWKKKKRIFDSTRLPIVCPSRWLEEKVRRSILINQMIVHIPNGIDRNIFTWKDRDQARRELGLPLNKRIIMFMSAGGSLNEFKGWQFTKALRSKFPADDILWLCIGHKPGGKKDRVPGLVNIDYVADAGVLAKYYSASDIYLFPSLAENFPLQVIEAMSCGVPVLSFDVGGVKEALAHGSGGYIARYRDLADLAQGFKSLLGLKDDRRKEISEFNAKIVQERYSIMTMAEKYLGLYEQFLAE
jgi:glycosyltransferase involved in cell wall biosynthesis